MIARFLSRLSSTNGLLLLILIVIIHTVAVVYPKLSFFWPSVINPFYFYFASITIFLIVVVSCLLIRQPLRLSFTLIDVGYSLFVMYVFVQGLFFRKVNLTDDAYLLLLCFYGIYLAIRYGLSINNCWYLLYCLITLASLSALYGILQYVDLLPKRSETFLATGFFINPGPYGGYLASLLLVSVGVLLAQGKKSGHIYFLLVIVIVLISTSLLLSQSRTAWLASLSGLTILYTQRNTLLWHQVRGVVRRPLLIAGFILVGIALIYGLWMLREDSVYGRLLIWKVSLSMIPDNILLGIGYDQFNTLYNDFQAFYFSMHNSLSKDAYLADTNYYAFNEFLKIIIELGIVGLLLFTPLLWLSYTAKSGGNSILPIAKACFFTIVIFGLFSYPYSCLSIVLNLTLSIAIISKFYESNPVLRINLGRLNTSLLAFFSTIVTVWFATLTYDRYEAVRIWQRASKIITVNPDQALLLYEEIYPSLAYRGSFLYNYGAELAELEEHQKSIDILKEAQRNFSHVDLFMYLGNNYQALGNYRQAEEAYQHASNMIPCRLYPRYLLAKLYKETGQERKASRLAEFIIKMKVKVPSHTTDKIRNEMIELANQP